MFMNWAINPGAESLENRALEHGVFILMTGCLERIVYYSCILFAVYTLNQRPYSQLVQSSPDFRAMPYCLKNLWDKQSYIPRLKIPKLNPHNTFHLSIAIQVSMLTSTF